MWSRKPRTEHQNGEKVILETLNLAWLVPDKLVWLFKKLIICRDFPTWPSLGFTDNDETKKNPVSSSSLGKCLVLARHQRRMARLLLADSDTTMTQIITYDNQGKQKTISECSRRPHWVPLLPPKNRKLRLQFIPAHQHWTAEDQKYTAWSAESWFLLCHSYGGVRAILLWIKGCWWCNGVEDNFLAHFGPLRTNWASFNHHSRPVYCCWPLPLVYHHRVPIL